MKYGEPVSFEFVSADASTAAPLVVRRAGHNGAGSGVTLGAQDRLIIQKLTSVIATTTANIFADTDGGGTLDAGDLMCALGTGLTVADFNGTDGQAGSKGVMPKVIAAGAGQIYIAGVGVLVKG